MGSHVYVAAGEATKSGVCMVFLVQFLNVTRAALWTLIVKRIDFFAVTVYRHVGSFL